MLQPQPEEKGWSRGTKKENGSRSEWCLFPPNQVTVVFSAPCATVHMKVRLVFHRCLSTNAGRGAFIHTAAYFIALC